MRLQNNVYGTEEHNENRAAAPEAPERLLAALRSHAPRRPNGAVSGMSVRSECYFGKNGLQNALFSMGQALAGHVERDVYVYLCNEKRFSDEEWELVSASLFQPKHRYHVALPAPAASLLQRPLDLPGESLIYALPEQAKVFDFLLSVPRLGAVVSGRGADQTLLLWDNAALCCHEGLFADFVPRAKPVARTLEKSAPPSDALLHLQEDKGAFLLAKDTPNGFFVPPDLLPETDPVLRAAQAEQLERHRRTFIERAKGEGWTDVLPRVFLEAVSLNQSCRFPAASLFGRQELVLRGAPLRAALQTMLSCLELYPNYRVIWTDKPLRVWTALSRTRGALLYDSTETTRVLQLCEDYDCFGLRDWADSFPRGEDRGQDALRALLEDFPAE